MTRRERENIRRRDEMMAAAARLFADRGYVRTTMAEIAKRAEFALGTIYQSFRTKEDVYFSILSEKSDELIAILDREELKAFPPDAALERAVRIVLEFFEQNIDFFRIYITDWGTFEANLTGDYRRILKEKYDRFLAFFTGIIQRGVAGGVLKPYDAVETAYVLVGILSAYIFQWSVEPKTAPFVEKTEMIVRLFLEGARA
ncbi:MAG: TetR/AcrR family transcriptional regulator [Deltaproteobacteria bacterium]|nr:TetR/AcrR family transcriptional regulator [Candidatus Zymogenaceae bacterium]